MIRDSIMKFFIPPPLYLVQGFGPTIQNDRKEDAQPILWRASERLKVVAFNCLVYN